MFRHKCPPNSLSPFLVSSFSHGVVHLGHICLPHTSNRERVMPKKWKQGELSAWLCNGTSGSRFSEQMKTRHYLHFGSDVWNPGASLQFDFYKGNEEEKKRITFLWLFSNKISTQTKNFWTLTTSSSTDNDNYSNCI